MSFDWFDKYKGSLILPYGEEGGGFVIIPIEDQRVTALYTATKMELILALNQELLVDAHLPALARGWRTPEQIVSLLKYPIEQGSLRRAVSQINCTFREAAAESVPDVAASSLLSTQRKIGIRLTWPLEIIVPYFDPPGR